jgi:hypothetical protein
MIQVFEAIHKQPKMIFQELTHEAEDSPRFMAKPNPNPITNN